MAKRKPTKSQIKKAWTEIIQEDAKRYERFKGTLDKRNSHDRNLPSENPDHTCNMLCDGQDGQSSYCYRLRSKLGLV